ncbi:hypothetical protein F7725_020346 [Dissostichus mawsoni]|uniref:EF-hand domain-containing protein n=1 Tax=Dissostichus mawsoni TaxID=36200 RepID=A0A7J5YGB8_DISMA|nr:hypothetical protein F7725_020346 [Dissostichus mawsoni]
MNLAKRLIGGIIDVVSNIDPAQFVPSSPPPQRRPLNFAEAHENDEEKQFRRVFQQLAGNDMEVSPKELMDILNRIIGKHGGLKTDGFSIESCRSMVAVMDSDSTGKLGFHEFKYMWNNIKKWQGNYLKFDADGSGTINSEELPKAFTAAAMSMAAWTLTISLAAWYGWTPCAEPLRLDKDNSGCIDLDIKENPAVSMDQSVSIELKSRKKPKWDQSGAEADCCTVLLLASHRYSFLSFVFYGQL